MFYKIILLSNYLLHYLKNNSLVNKFKKSYKLINSLIKIINNRKKYENNYSD
jgi:hypothetical protein